MPVIPIKCKLHWLILVKKSCLVGVIYIFPIPYVCTPFIMLSIIAKMLNKFLVK
jgi:hypothetical protein